MNKSILKLIFPLLSLIAIFSCDDSTEGIGTVLTDPADQMDIKARVFRVSTESAALNPDSVITSSTAGYLGRIKDEDTKTRVTYNYMTQFHTFDADDIFPTREMFVNGIKADSCKILLAYNSVIGDSTSLINVTLHELDRPLEDNGNNYFVTFSPSENGYLRDEKGIHINKSFTFTGNVHGTGYPLIEIDLNEEYIGKDGKPYDNYGCYILEKFFNNRELFKNPYRFVNEVCPGFYYEVNAGIGAVAKIQIAQLNVYYRYNNNGKEETGVTYFDGTDEVLTGTYIKQDASEVNSLLKTKSCSYLKTPAGIYTQVELPIDQIMRDSSDTKGYSLRNDSLNTANMIIQRLVSEEKNTVMQTPATLLALPDTMKYTFFKDRKVADNRSSFIITYSSTSNGYNFSNISKLVTYLAYKKQDDIDKIRKERNNPLYSSEDYNKEFPNWNKIALIPVTTSYTTAGTSTELTKVSNDISLSCTQLEGGKDNKESIKLNVIYSSFNK